MNPSTNAPNPSGLVLTVGGKAGGASILSGVESFDKLRTAVLRQAQDNRRPGFIRSLRGGFSGHLQKKRPKLALQRLGSAAAEGGRQWAEEGGMLAGETGGRPVAHEALQAFAARVACSADLALCAGAGFTGKPLKALYRCLFLAEPILLPGSCMLLTGFLSAIAGKAARKWHD